MLGKLIGKKEDKGFFLELKEEEGAAPAITETPTPAAKPAPKAEAPKPKPAPKAVAKSAPAAPKPVTSPAPVAVAPQAVMFETMPGRRTPGPSLDGFKAMARELQGRTMG